MDLLFSIAMLLAGLILIFSLSKENKIFFGAAAFFFPLGLGGLGTNLPPALGFFSWGWGLPPRGLSGAGRWRCAGRRRCLLSGPI